MGKGAYLSPWLLQAIGVLLLIGSAGYWAVTGHQSTLLVAAAMSLIGLGAYSGLHVSIRQELRQDALEGEEKIDKKL